MIRRLLLALGFWFGLLAQAGATPAYNSAGTFSGSGSGGLTVNIPAASSGDVYIICIQYGVASATITPPAGWNAVAGSLGAPPSATSQAFYKVASGSDANPAFTFTSSGASYGGSWRITGNKSTPIGAVGTPGVGSTNPHTSSSVTTTAANSLVVACDLSGANSSQITDAPATWTLASSVHGTQGTATLWYKAVASSGGTSGAISINEYGSADWSMNQIEILNAGGAAAVLYNLLTTGAGN